MSWQTLSFHFKQAYEGGYRYLDKCGEFMLAAADKLDLIPGEAKPTGGKMEMPERGVNVAFNALDLTVSQELAADDDGTFFVSLCSGLADLVAAQFGPKSILSNGFALKSYWPCPNTEELLSASLKLGGSYHHELGKVVGMAPRNKKLDYLFTSGSTDFHVLVEPVTFEKVNLPKQNANFRANRLERSRVSRYNKFAEYFNVNLGHAVLMTLDMIENDPPEGSPLKKNFEELKRQNEKLRTVMSLK